jgi:hypothetical protein
MRILYPLQLCVLLGTLACMAPVHADEAPPPLSSEAVAALAGAENAVNQAQQRKALWTTAQNALNEAKTVAKKGDSAAVRAQSAIAVEQAFLGMAQQGYPLVAEH